MLSTRFLFGIPSALWCLAIGLSLTHAVPAYAQPADARSRELCATEEGRRQLLASRAPREITDLEYQEMGMALQEGREPNLEAYKRKWLDEFCGIRPVAGPVWTTGLIPRVDPSRPDVFIFDLPAAWAECNVDYDEDCEDIFKLPVPETWQYCRILFETSQRGKGVGYSKRPAMPLPDEPGLTRRFRSYDIHYWAHGQHHVLDRQGSKMRLHSFRAELISPTLSDEKRRAFGCDFYPLPVAQPPAPRPPTTPAPAPGPSLPEFAMPKGTAAAPTASSSPTEQASGRLWILSSSSTAGPVGNSAVRADGRSNLTPNGPATAIIPGTTCGTGGRDTLWRPVNSMGRVGHARLQFASEKAEEKWSNRESEKLGRSLTARGRDVSLRSKGACGNGR